MNYGFILLIYVNKIITTVNDLRVWHVSTFIGYFDIILKYIEVVSICVGYFEIILKHTEILVAYFTCMAVLVMRCVYWIMSRFQWVFSQGSVLF